MGRLYLCRHGTTAYNQGGVGSDRIRSHRDVPLTDEGIREGRALGQKFQDDPIVKIYTSDLSRASDTAQMVARRQEKKPKIIKAKELRSWDMGELTGKKTDPEIVKQITYYVTHDTEKVPGGESFKQFAGRLLAYVEPIFAEAAKLPGDECITIITHGRCVQIIDLWVEAGLDEKKMHEEKANDLATEPDTVKPGGFLEFEYEDGKWVRNDEEDDDQPEVDEGRETDLGRRMYPRRRA